MAAESLRLAALRARLTDKIMGQLDECYINGSMEHRLPGNINISFAYVEGESLLMGMHDVAVSTGSACTSATSCMPISSDSPLNVGEADVDVAERAMLH